MIKFDQVSKEFCRGDKTALEDVSFEIEDGEFVFVTGHSGCGKTTLLRLLLREFQPTDGAVYFDDRNLRRLSRGKVAKHRRKVGVMFQDYKLIDELNVEENIALPLLIAHEKKREIKRRIGELLALLNLEGYDKVFPSQLSGGEAQRVGLARALVTAPEVIFADEPTGNLDAENAEQLLRLLESVNKCGTTIIMTTHDLSLIDKIPGARHLEFRQGKLVCDSACHRRLYQARQLEKKQAQAEQSPVDGTQDTAPTDQTPPPAPVVTPATNLTDAPETHVPDNPPATAPGKNDLNAPPTGEPDVATQTESIDE